MAMANADYNSHGARLYILNGQPLIIRDSSSINTVNSISADILQQALQDAGTSSVNDSLTVLEDSSYLPSKQSVNGRSIDRNEYVAILGGEEDADDSSAIHLTLEQAAELGLQFESDGQNFDSLMRRTGPKQKQFIFSAGSHENETLFQRDVNHTQPHTEMGRGKVESGGYGTSIGIITSQGQNDASVNQQVVFIPQIINGTVAYAVQMAGEQNEFVQDSFPVSSNDQNHIKTTTSVLSSGENFNLTGLTSSSVLSLIQPTLTTPQVSIMSSDNGIEPMLNSNSQNTSNVNLHTNGTEKLTTYILPSSLHIDRPNNNATTKSSGTIGSYQHTTSLQQIPDSVRKQQKLLNNGVTKQQSILKSLQPSLSKELNTDISVDLAESPQKTSHLIINGMPELKPFSHSSEETKEKCKEESVQDKSKELLFDRCTNNTEDKSTTATSDLNKDITVHMDTCGEEGKTTPTLITPEDGSVPQDVSAALNRASIKADTKKPLGSNENPIQLVQRGQTFHSVQALSQEQLKRVMTVLKQEHLDTGKSSKNILYDAESNTRIIYRVVCPEELYLQKKEDENAPKRRGRRKKNQPSSPQNNNINNNSNSNNNNNSNNNISSSGNNNSNNTNNNNNNNTEAEDETVPRRKQVFPRTRSGRLSRPPKHMVRDYKRIRKMDVDDSDGVYSDYHSDHDEENITPANNLLPGLSAKQKHNITTNFRCPTCGKIYLGLVRMAQHFDKYPDHGSAEYLKTLQNAHSETEGSTGDVRPVVGGGTGGNGIWRNGRIGRKRGRGRGSYITSVTTSHKCHRLRETLDACDKQEIVNIAGPVVASVLSAWDLLLLRIDAVREESKVAALYQELKHLLHKIRLISSKLFKPLDHQFSSAAATGDAFTVDIDDDLMSYVLELPCGMYFGSDIELCSPDYQIVAQKRPRKELDSNDSAVTDAPKSKLQRDCKETSPHEEILSSLTVVTKSQESNLNSEEKMENSDSNVSQPFMLTGEEMMCDSEDRGGLDSVDEIVSERLQNLTGSGQSQSEMLKSDVDELMKGFTVNILDHRVVDRETGQNQSDLEPPDDLIDGFSSISQRPHVSASTEDLIKSLEHFGSELNQPEDRTSYPSSSIDRENFPRMPNVDTLDFEVLSREFHSNNR